MTHTDNPRRASNRGKLTLEALQSVQHLNRCAAACALGVARASLYKAAKKFDLTFAAPPGRSIDEYRALTHLSQSDAARVLGCTAANVSKVARTHGLTFAVGKSGRPIGQARPIDDYRALTHLSRSDAARVLGCSRGLIGYIAKRHGLTFATGKTDLTPYLKPKAAPAQVDEAPTAAPSAAPVVPPLRLVPSAEMAPAPVEPPALPMADIWSPERDAEIHATGGAYGALAALAKAWDLSLPRVTARWHVVRSSAWQPRPVRAVQQ